MQLTWDVVYWANHEAATYNTISKISAENIRLIDLCPQAFGVGLSDLLGEHHKDEEDDESLEGHHDGVDVGQRDQLLHFHYQHP